MSAPSSSSSPALHAPVDSTATSKPVFFSPSSSAVCAFPPPSPFPLTHADTQCCVLLYNLSKKLNIGSLIRTCVAFSVSCLVVISSRPNFSLQGSFGTVPYLRLCLFDSLTSAVHAIKAAQFVLIGVEIGDDALPIHQTPSPLAPKTCFVFGNEGQGLNAKILPMCDRLVFIDQSGAGTASLNVSVAAGIVLHAYQAYARYPCNRREGSKFVIDESKKLQAQGRYHVPRDKINFDPDAAVAEDAHSAIDQLFIDEEQQCEDDA